MKGPETIPVAARDYLDARRAYLIQFVTRHYGRRETTVREDYAASLYFLDGRLADATIEANRKSRIIETFLAGDGDEIDVAVKNVSVEDLRTPPYKATGRLREDPLHPARGVPEAPGRRRPGPW